MEKTSKIYMDMLNISRPEIVEKLNEEEQKELGDFIANTVKLGIFIRQQAIVNFIQRLGEENNNGK